MRIKDMDPATLKQHLDQGTAVLVDVREVAEYQQERIGEAYLMPLSAYAPDNLPRHDGKIVVFQCATGTRTGMYGPQLAMTVPEAADVFHLAGGIVAWRSAGFETKSGA